MGLYCTSFKAQTPVSCARYPKVWLFVLQTGAILVMRLRDVRSAGPSIVAIMACLAQLALGQPGGVQPGELADTATASRIPWDDNDVVMANQVTPLGWGSTTLVQTGSGQGIGQRTVMYAGQDAIYGTLVVVVDHHVAEVFGIHI
jgi:hypothetical protein